MPRPTTPLLSRAAIVERAVKIIDADGVAGLSMRRLAAELGVSGPSLYHHFRSKDEILDEIIDQINSQIRFDDRDEGWEAVLISYAYQLRALLIAHPHLVEFVALRPVPPSGLRIYEEMTARMEQSGWDAAPGREVGMAVENLVYGAALMANAPDVELTAEQTELYPMLAATLQHVPRKSPDDGFEAGFTAMIEGLRTLAPDGPPLRR
jgi:AcrR family transcriptional regulator